MGECTVEQLRERGIDVRLEHPPGLAARAATWCSPTATSSTPTPSCGPPASSPTRCSTPATCRSTSAAGSSATADLQVDGVEDAWAAGDVRRRPRPHRTPAVTARPTPSTPCGRPRSSPTTSSPSLRGRAAGDYRHKYVGSVAGLGLHKGVANVYGIKLAASRPGSCTAPTTCRRVPTFNRKVRVIADWTLALFFKREIVSLGELEAPHNEFRAATTS